MSRKEKALGNVANTTLVNYLPWYLLRKPQNNSNSVMGISDIHLGNSGFEKIMNNLFGEFD